MILYLDLKDVSIDTYKKVEPKEQKSNQKQWVTNVILKKIRHRNKLFAQRKGNPNDVNIKRNYILFRNAINRNITAAKKSYWSSYFVESKNDMKKKHGKVLGN